MLGHDVCTFLQLKVRQRLLNELFVVLNAKKFAHKGDVFSRCQSSQQSDFLFGIGQEVLLQEAQVLEEINIEGSC